MTIREIPIEALFGDVVQRSDLLHSPEVVALGSVSLIEFVSGRWLFCNLNTGTLKAYERHERTTESI